MNITPPRRTTVDLARLCSDTTREVAAIKARFYAECETASPLVLTSEGIGFYDHSSGDIHMPGYLIRTRGTFSTPVTFMFRATPDEARAYYAKRLNRRALIAADYATTEARGAWTGD